jgi:hypothetical protein
MAQSGDSSGGEGAFGGYDGVDECNGDLSPVERIAGGLDYFWLADNPGSARTCPGGNGPYCRV